MLLRRIARPLLATAFIAEGADALRNPADRAKSAASLVDKATDALPENTASSVPTDPATLVRINAAVQIGGGVLLALGKAPRLASAALAATVIPQALTTQAFWEEDDPARKAEQRTAFLKDVSLLGGLMIAAADTGGKPSLGWRGRRAAQAAVAALPFATNGENDAAERARQLAHDAADRARPLAQQAAERGRGLAAIAAEKGRELAATVQERGPEWVATAREQGTGLAHAAREQGAGLAHAAREQSAELAGGVRTRMAAT